MGHALYSLLFTAVAARWLAGELGRTPDYRRHGRWLVVMVAAQLVASALSYRFGGVLGNALLHGLGGGVAAALLFTYLVGTFEVAWSVRVQAVGLFILVSTLGVLNELGEYVVELFHLAVYSEDTHDTWRDFTANTVGAALGFVLLLALSPTVRRQAKGPARP